MIGVNKEFDCFQVPLCTFATIYKKDYGKKEYNQNCCIQRR